MQLCAKHPNGILNFPCYTCMYNRLPNQWLQSFQVCIYQLYELFTAMTTTSFTTRIVQHITNSVPLLGRPGRFYQRASTCRQSLPWPNPNSHHWAEDALFLGNYFARALPCQRDSEAHKIRSDVISIEWQTNNADWQIKIYFCIRVRLHIHVLEVSWCTYVICGACTWTVCIHVAQFMTSTAATHSCASEQNRQYVKQYMSSKMKRTMFKRIQQLTSNVRCHKKIL